MIQNDNFTAHDMIEPITLVTQQPQQQQQDAKELKWSRTLQKSLLSIGESSFCQMKTKVHVHTINTI